MRRAQAALPARRVAVQVAVRVDGAVASSDFKVELRAVDVAGGADEGDRIAAPDGIATTDVTLRVAVKWIGSQSTSSALHRIGRRFG